MSESQGPKRTCEKRKRLGITLGASWLCWWWPAPFMVWHEQPSFCNAICHDPMDPYLHVRGRTCQPATDKWGNGGGRRRQHVGRRAQPGGQDLHGLPRAAA